MTTYKCKNCGAYVSSNTPGVTNEQIAEAHEQNCVSSPGFKERELRKALLKEIRRKKA